MEEYKTFIEVIAGGLSVLGVLWVCLKVGYRNKEKFLFITNTHILPVTFWNDVKSHLEITDNGGHDHAYRPLIFIPSHYKPYLNMRDGEKVILESKEDDGSSLSITAEGYWIPENLEPWSKMRHAMMSLIVRRYFKIERPLFQTDVEAPSGWVLARHHRKHLDPLHRCDEENPDKLIWAVSEKYSFRFFNPFAEIFSSDSDTDALIEYCGISIRVRKKSIFLLD